MFRLKNKSYYSDDVWGARFDGGVTPGGMFGSFTGVHWGENTNIWSFKAKRILEGPIISVSGNIGLSGANGLYNFTGAKFGFITGDAVNGGEVALHFSDIRVKGNYRLTDIVGKDAQYSVYLIALRGRFNYTKDNFMIAGKGEIGLGVARGLHGYIDKNGLSFGIYLGGDGIAGGGEIKASWNPKTKNESNEENDNS